MNLRKLKGKQAIILSILFLALCIIPQLDLPKEFAALTDYVKHLNIYDKFIYRWRSVYLHPKTYQYINKKLSSPKNVFLMDKSHSGLSTQVPAFSPVYVVDGWCGNPIPRAGYLIWLVQKAILPPKKLYSLLQYYGVTHIIATTRNDYYYALSNTAAIQKHLVENGYAKLIYHKHGDKIWALIPDLEGYKTDNLASIFNGAVVQDIDNWTFMLTDTPAIADTPMVRPSAAERFFQTGISARKPDSFATFVLELAKQYHVKRFRIYWADSPPDNWKVELVEPEVTLYGRGSSSGLSFGYLPGKRFSEVIFEEPVKVKHLEFFFPDGASIMSLGVYED